MNMEKENLNEVLDGMEHTEEVKEDAVQEVKDDVAVQPQIDETVQTEEAIQEEQTVAEDVTPAEVTAETSKKKFSSNLNSQMRARFSCSDRTRIYSVDQGIGAGEKNRSDSCGT